MYQGVWPTENALHRHPPPFGGLLLCRLEHHANLQVGSAVLLLSRFVGLQWNPDEALRLAEEKTASASEAVNRLSDNVGTLEQRLTAVEEPGVEGAQGEPVVGGGSTQTYPSPARTGSAAREAKLADGGSGVGTPPGGVIPSPSIAQNMNLEAALGAASVARETEAIAKESSGGREVRSDQILQQASSAGSTGTQLSAQSRNGGDRENGDDVASRSSSSRSDGDVDVGVDDDQGEDSSSSASSAAGLRRRYNRAAHRDIDSDDERAAPTRRSNSGGNTEGDDRLKEGSSRPSVEARPTDRPSPDAAAFRGASSSSSTRKKDDDQVLRQPSTGRLSPLRSSRASVVADAGGSRSDAIGTNLKPAPDEPAAEAAGATTVLKEEEKERALRVELKGGSTPYEASTADPATAAFTAAREVGGSAAEKRATEAEDGRKNRQARRAEEEDQEEGAKPTANEATSKAATAKASTRTRVSTSETPRADELAAPASDRKGALASDQNGAQATHGSGGREDEGKGTTPHTTTKVVAAQHTDAATSAVLARSSSSASERVLVDAPEGSGGEGSATKKGTGENEPNGDADDEARVRGDGGHGRSNSAAGDTGSASAGAPGKTPLDNEARRSSSFKGPPQPADRTFDAPRATSSSIKLDPLEPRSTGGGSAEGAVEVSKPTGSTGKIHGGLPHDTRVAKTHASVEIEGGEGAERPIASGRLSARGQKAGGTAEPRKTGVTAAAPAAKASGKRGDIEGGSGGGRSFSDDSSHASGSSSWTSRTGETGSSFSEESTAASTRASSPSEKGRAGNSAAVKRSSSGSSSSGGRRRRSRSRSKKSQVVTDGVFDGTAGRREDEPGAQTGDHQPEGGAASGKRRTNGRHDVDADAAIAVAAVDAAHPSHRGSSWVSSPPSGLGVEDHELDVKTDRDG